MSSSVFLTLLNPFMSLIFSAVFFGLWRFGRNQPYLLMLTASYLAGAAGFILQVYHFPIGLFWTRGGSSALFLLAAATISVAVCWRYQRRVPTVSLIVIALAGMAAFVWFWFVTPDITSRVYAINFAIGGMLLVTAREMARSTRQDTVDRFLLAMLVLQGVLFFVRTIAAMRPEEMHTDPGLNDTYYWLIFTFSHAVLSVATVFMLANAAIIDIVGDLRDESKTDAMTQLWNRRGFEALVKTALSERAPRASITLILGDLDHFKRINDTFGHHAGDDVIVSFANIIRDTVGSLQAGGRLGGEEFGILLVGADTRVGELVAQGIRMAFSISPPPASIGQEVGLTASFGVAQWRKGESYESLMERADKALYAAKYAGRDCVFVDGAAQPDIPSQSYFEARQGSSMIRLSPARL